MVAALVRDDVLVSSLIRQPVLNEVGEKIGDVDDLIMDKQGHVSAVLVEVGSFIGVEEKLVAVPFSSLSIGFATAGKPRIVAELSRPYLAEASVFKAPGLRVSPSFTVRQHTLPRTNAVASSKSGRS